LDSSSNIQAERCKQFIKSLVLVEGEWYGKPFTLYPFQEQIIDAIFALRQPDQDGNLIRKHKEVFVSMGRGSAKTTLLSAIGLFFLCCDGVPNVNGTFEAEMRGEVYLAASTQKQALRMWNNILAMLDCNNSLARRCTVNKSAKTITYTSTGSVLMVISGEHKFGSGLSPTVCLYDELHEITDRRLYGRLRTGFGKRRQPILIGISTAGQDRNNNLCWEYYQRYQSQLKAGGDPTFKAVVFEMPDGADWKDKDNWNLALPGLQYGFPKLVEIEEYYEAAIGNAAKTNEFINWYCNKWTSSSVSWLTPGAWDNCYQDYTETDLEGRECYAGLDLGSVSDLTVLSLVFNEPDCDEFKVLCWTWASGYDIQTKERAHHIPYRQWERDGFITLTSADDRKIHWQTVIDDISAIADRFTIKEFAIDAMFQSDVVFAGLRDQGLVNLIEYRAQPLKLSVPSMRLEEWILTGKLHHNGNPVLTHCVDVVQVKKQGDIVRLWDGGNKDVKVDAVIATLYGFDRAMAAMTAEAENTGFGFMWV